MLEIRKAKIEDAEGISISQELIKQGATEQWVSVEKNNQKGIPFYLARGFQIKDERKGFRSEDSDDAISLRMLRILK